MKLELKHLAPYLPYGLKGIETYKGSIKYLISIDLTLGLKVGDLKEDYLVHFNSFKPILRPLSDLKKDAEIKILVEKTFETSEDGWNEFYNNPLDYPYYAVEVLLKHHFDVFGLIPKGLAIDINTLEDVNN